MSAPGWYPDPQDASRLRYYDGQVWTEHQQPFPGQQPDPATAQPADPQHFPATGEPTPQAPQSPDAGGWQATEQFAAQADPNWAQAGPAPTEPYWDSGQASPQAGAPAWPAAGAWQQQQYPPQQYPPQQPARRSRAKLPLIIATVVIVVAGLVTGGYFLLFNKSESPEFTYAGNEIKDPASVLSTAEKNLAGLVKQRHGVKGKDTRCYFALPKKPAEGAESSDVADELYCGPVLFVDGDPSQPYLKFALSDATKDDVVTLTPSAQPESPEPTAPPADAELKRPDGATAPKGSGGLKAPAPPPADKNVVLATTLTNVTVPDAPDGAVMGSPDGGIRITKLGEVKRYGHGDDARSAPEGQKLIAFQTTGIPGTDGDGEDLTSEAEISVDGASGTPVPELSSGEYVVVAVPDDASSVDLVLEEDGLTQSLSLLDGTPGKNNVILFTRSNLEGQTPVKAKGVLTFKPKVKFDDGTTGTSEPATITINTLDLMYKSPPYEKPVTASSPSKALLHVSITYRGVHESGEYGFPPQMLSFTPDGGSPVKAQNISPREHKIYNVFEVPADMTTGTLTVSGSVSQTYSSGGGHYTFGVKSPIEMTVDIPLGD